MAAVKQATFGGGCFWCVEAVFQMVRGVSRVVSGYSGGHTESPTYQQVCSGETGHAEVVQVEFDPEVVSYEDLLRVFFTTHNPTTLNRQGADAGTQYRSVIFAHGPEQAEAARAIVAELTEAGVFDKAIVTEISSFTRFFLAEDYHQGYFDRNPSQPYCLSTIPPKVAKLRQKLGHLLKG